MAKTPEDEKKHKKHKKKHKKEKKRKSKDKHNDRRTSSFEEDVVETTPVKVEEEEKEEEEKEEEEVIEKRVGFRDDEEVITESERLEDENNKPDDASIPPPDDHNDDVQEATSSSHQTIQMHVSEPNPATDPILISFPSGLPYSLRPKTNHPDSDSDSDSDSESEENIPSSPPTFHLQKRSQTATILKGNDSTCNYIAATDTSKKQRHSQFYLALYDKQTQTLQVRKTHSGGSVLSLQQSIKGYNPKLARVVSPDETVDTSIKPSSTSLDGLTYQQKRQAVFGAFGSAKKQKIIKSEIANQVKMDSAVESAMISSIKDQANLSEQNRAAIHNERDENSFQKPTATEAAIAEARKLLLPEFDPTTPIPSKIYDIRKMTGQDAWDQISRMVDACLQQPQSQQTKTPSSKFDTLTSRGIWPPHIITLLQTSKSKTQIKIIVFLRHILLFHKLFSTKPFSTVSPETVSKKYHIPSEVSRRCHELFTVPRDGKPGGFMVTKPLQNKRIVFLLILYLMAVNYREMKVANIKSFVKDVLQLEMGEVVKLYREAGCVCKKGAGGIVSVSLSAPLVFPEVQRLKRRR